MTPAPVPRLSRRPSLPLIWVVPLVALAVAAWMVFRQFRNRGPEITIEFASGAGIEAGKTELEHKGVSVGVVKSVTLAQDLRTVLVQVRLEKQGEPLARAGSKFWVVHPEFSLSGIHGLETLVTGVRLKVRPGAGAPARRFRGLDRPPPVEEPEAGRAFVLRTDKLNGLAPGAPVYFRGVKVGAIETTRLADDALAAVARIRIYTPYADLVRTNTEFWDVSGVSLKLGLSGLDVKSTTLQSLLVGGVEFATSDRNGLAPPALENTEFRLRPEPEKEWLSWAARIPIHPVDTTPETPRSAGSAPLATGTVSAH